MPLVAQEPLEEAVAAVVAHLDAGGLAVLPTDTVYGIAVRADDPDGLAELYRRKGRDPSVPTAVLLGDCAHAESLWAHASAGRRRMEARFWPGPLTIVDERDPDIGWDLGGDPRSIGLRCPDHPLVRGVASAVGPLAVSSANRSGAEPIRRVDRVEEALGEGLLVVDGGVLDATPSTVIDLRDGFRVLRDGAISESVLRSAWSPPTMSDVEGE